MTVGLENRLRKAQRQMLRMILGSPRRRGQPSPDIPHSHTPHHPPTTDDTPHNQEQTSSSDSADDVDSNIDPTHDHTPADETLEPWADWIKRCTHQVEQLLQTLGIADWATQRKQHKEALKARVAGHDHGRWTSMALHWDPESDYRRAPTRRPGRPKKRWTDD